VPNLFTIPGDPFAGALLAMADQGTAAPLPWAAAVSALALYAGGLLDNDLTGLDEDRRLRPDRPLPSGQVPLRTAAAARSALLAAGVLAALAAGPAAGAVAAGIVAAILLYHRVLSRSAILGAAALGLCRAGSLGLGAAAVGSAGWRVAAASLLWAAAIASISAYARREAEVPGRPASVGRWLSLWPVAQAAAALTSHQPASLWVALALLAMAAAAAAARRAIPAS